VKPSAETREGQSEKGARTALPTIDTFIDRVNKTNYVHRTENFWYTGRKAVIMIQSLSMECKSR